MDDVRVQTALAAAKPVPYWLDQGDAPSRLPALAGPDRADLAVIGGGYTGLWAALQAKEADPDRDVVLLEADRIANAGSGRNGGFCSASITHGVANGLDRFPAELPELDRLGRENLDEIEQAVTKYGIDCDFRRTGELAVATGQWQLTGLREAATALTKLGHEVVLMDAAAVRAELNSPAYAGGLWDTAGCATVDPARLAWGLLRACLEAGVRVYEGSPVRGIDSEPGGLRLRTPQGSVTAGRVAMGTGAFSPLLAAAAVLRGPGLRLRAHDRAAVGRPAGEHRLAAPAGRGGQRQPVSLLPADPRQPDPVGRVRRRLLLREQDRR